HRISQRPLALDRVDAFGVGAGEIAPALENLERVFLVGEAERLGLLHAKQRHVARRGLPGLSMRVLPAVVDVDVAVAPLGPFLVVERRAAIVGAVGQAFHRLGPCSPDGAQRNPGRAAPHYASLHAGYELMRDADHLRNTTTR